MRFYLLSIKVSIFGKKYTFQISKYQQRNLKIDITDNSPGLHKRDK